MQDLLINWFPNMVGKSDEFTLAVWQTLIMVGWSGMISLVLGLVAGVLLVVWRPGGLVPQRACYEALDKVVNLFRSIPFIILLTSVMPLTRLIMGTAIGVEGAIVPLVFGTVPFFARQVESALSQVPPGLVEAAKAMGDSNLAIVWGVYLRESIPQLARAVSITAISLISYTAMAGVVGAGGLGDFAIRYGHDRNQFDCTIATVIVLVLIVSIIQMLGTFVARKSTH